MYICVCVCLYVCVYIYTFLYIYVSLRDKAHLNTHQGAQRDNGGGALKRYPSRLLPGPSQKPSTLYKPI